MQQPSSNCHQPSGGHKPFQFHHLLASLSHSPNSFFYDFQLPPERFLSNPFFISPNSSASALTFKLKIYNEKSMQIKAHKARGYRFGRGERGRKKPVPKTRPKARRMSRQTKAIAGHLDTRVELRQRYSSR